MPNSLIALKIIADSAPLAAVMVALIIMVGALTLTRMVRRDLQNEEKAKRWDNLMLTTIDNETGKTFEYGGIRWIMSKDRATNVSTR